MTNHPRSPRAKFSLGQVVRLKSDNIWYGRITGICEPYRDGRANDYFTYEFGLYGRGQEWHDEPLLRSLTKKEAGH